jgi:hypothetical protein
MSPAAVLMASPVASHTLSAGMNQQPQRHEGAKKNHLANKEIYDAQKIQKKPVFMKVHSIIKLLNSKV